MHGPIPFLVFCTVILFSFKLTFANFRNVVFLFLLNFAQSIESNLQKNSAGILHDVMDLVTHHLDAFGEVSNAQ